MQNLDNLSKEDWLMIKKLLILVLNNKNLNTSDGQYWIQKILLKKKFGKRFF